MQKLLCLLCSTILLISMCSCTKIDNNSSGTMSGTEGELSKDTVTEQIQSSKVESVTESTVSQTISSEQKPVSQPVSSVASQPVKETVSTPVSIQQNLSQFSYTVNDAENSRGLSTVKKEFSFGVAKDGVPHEQSVINQRTFDAFENVRALALDNKTQEKIMYLTFDNGYEYKNLTANILDTLKAKNVKAAFFVTLSYVKQNPQLIKRMIDEGHIVGNHSATHPSFPEINRTRMAQEIATLENYLRENFSYKGEYFRFPSGEYSECALELVSSIGFKSVFWSVAYKDWDTDIRNGADYAFSTVTSRFHPGAVILLHAVSQDNADALGRIIDEAINQGYTFKTLGEYFN